jgi:hypothetical protein
MIDAYGWLLQNLENNHVARKCVENVHTHVRIASVAFDNASILKSLASDKKKKKTLQGIFANDYHLLFFVHMLNCNFAT